MTVIYKENLHVCEENRHQHNAHAAVNYSLKTRPSRRGWRRNVKFETKGAKEVHFFVTNQDMDTTNNHHISHTSNLA